MNCPILLFFESYKDPYTVKALKNLLPFFKDHGFRSFALEQYNGKSQKNIVKQYADIAKLVSNALSTGKVKPSSLVPGEKLTFEEVKNEAVNNRNLYQEAIKQGFKLFSVDVDEARYTELSMLVRYNKDIIKSTAHINDIIAQASAKSTIKSSSDVMQTSFKQSFLDAIDNAFIAHVNDLFTAERNNHFVKKIDQICKDKPGDGIIGLFGWMHAGITHDLRGIGYTNQTSIFINGSVNNDAYYLTLEHHPEFVHETLMNTTVIINANQVGSQNDIDQYVLSEISYTLESNFDHQAAVDAMSRLSVLSDLVLL